jgi:hypothetical protein
MDFSQYRVLLKYHHHHLAHAAAISPATRHPETLCGLTFR